MRRCEVQSDRDCLHSHINSSCTSDLALFLVLPFDPCLAPCFPGSLTRCLLAIVVSRSIAE